MGYDSLIRGLVKSVVSPQFESMKIDATFTPWIGEGPSGKKSYGTPYVIRALVDFSGNTGTQRYTNNGALIVPVATLTLVDLPLPEPTPNVGQYRAQPIDMRDKVTLAGDTAVYSIVDLVGFADSATGAPFAPKVVLGVVARGM